MNHLIRWARGGGLSVLLLTGPLWLAGCGTTKPVTPLRPLSGRAASPTYRPAPSVTPSRPVVPQKVAPARRAIPPEAWRQEAHKWMGTPHRLGGLDRRGIDCSGFTLQVYRAVAGVALPHNAAQQYAYGVPVATSALQPGNLVFFSERGKGIFHVGLSLGGDQFAHASTRRGVIISSLREAYYTARFHGAKRLVP